MFTHSGVLKGRKSARDRMLRDTGLSSVRDYFLQAAQLPDLSGASLAGSANPRGIYNWCTIERRDSVNGMAALFHFLVAASHSTFINHRV